MHRSFRQHLLQFVAVALLALQWSAATHAVDHVLEPVHGMCALCHIAQDAAAGPAISELTIVHAPDACVVKRLHDNPVATIAWASRALRAPPLTA